MRLFVIKKKYIIYLSSFTVFLLFFLSFYKIKRNEECRLYQNDSDQTFMSYSKHEVGNKTTNNTEYFRPSQLPILNDREFKSGFFGEFYMKNLTRLFYLVIY
jgi:hypothetical protein